MAESRLGQELEDLIKKYATIVQKIKDSDGETEEKKQEYFEREQDLRDMISGRGINLLDQFYEERKENKRKNTLKNFKAKMK